MLHAALQTYNNRPNYPPKYLCQCVHDGLGVQHLIQNIDDEDDTEARARAHPAPRNWNHNLFSVGELTIKNADTWAAMYYLSMINQNDE